MNKLFVLRLLALRSTGEVNNKDKVENTTEDNRNKEAINTKMGFVLLFLTATAGYLGWRIAKSEEREKEGSKKNTNQNNQNTSSQIEDIIDREKTIEKKIDNLRIDDAGEIISEIYINSMSNGDTGQFFPLTKKFVEKYNEKNISISYETAYKTMDNFRQITKYSKIENYNEVIHTMYILMQLVKKNIIHHTKINDKESLWFLLQILTETRDSYIQLFMEAIQNIINIIKTNNNPINEKSRKEIKEMKDMLIKILQLSKAEITNRYDHNIKILS